MPVARRILWAVSGNHTVCSDCLAKLDEFELSHSRQDLRLEKEGLWMGDTVALGCDLRERWLVSNQAGAELVREKVKTDRCISTEVGH